MQVAENFSQTVKTEANFKKTPYPLLATPSHEFNSSLQDDQSVEESSTASEDIEEEEVTAEFDPMYGDEMFEEEEGDEDTGNGNEEDLSAEEAFKGEEEAEVRAEVEDKIEEIIRSLHIIYTIFLPPSTTFKTQYRSIS